MFEVELNNEVVLKLFSDLGISTEKIEFSSKLYDVLINEDLISLESYREKLISLHVGKNATSSIYIF